MKKFFSIKNIAAVLFIVFILAQFIPKKINQSNDFSQDISKVFPVNAGVEKIMKTSCNDCHSNHSDYPWYASVQPVRAWLDNHVEHGKKHLNFSIFASYKPRKQYHKLEEIVEQIEKGEMPLNSYTWTHRNAVLSDEQKQELFSWTKNCMDTMKVHHHPDSLIMKKR